MLIPWNQLVVAASLAVLVVASVEAHELVLFGGAGCGPDGEPGLTGDRGYTGRKITLDFKDADIVNVLRMLAEIGGENIVVTDDVKGRMTVRLVDVPWDQALDVVLEANRLACVKVGNVLGVSATSN